MAGSVSKYGQTYFPARSEFVPYRIFEFVPCISQSVPEKTEKDKWYENGGKTSGSKMAGRGKIPLVSHV